MDEIICIECDKPYIYTKAKKVSKTKCNKCYVKYFRDRIKTLAVEYKGGCCIKCGYNKCPQSMCFHHIKPEEKSFGISSGVNKSWEVVKQELDKCVLLCQNCHHELHAYFWKLEDLMAEKLI